MWNIPDSVQSECPLAFSELESVMPVARGGVPWDPFSQYPAVRLSADAHREMLGALARDVFGGRDAEWVRACVLASVAPLLASRVVSAMRRFNRRSGEEGELMSVALEAAQGALGTWSPQGAASFHGYVTVAVEAGLSRAAGLDSSHGSMPRSWRYAMRMLPSLRDEVRAREGREPFVEELRDLYLEKSREWASSLADESGGPGLEESIEGRLRSAGVFAVAARFADVCAAAPAPVPLGVASDNAGLRDVADAESVALQELSEGQVAKVAEYLQELGLAGPGAALAELSSPVAARLLGEGPLPVVLVRKERRAPADEDLLASWL